MKATNVENSPVKGDIVPKNGASVSAMDPDWYKRLTGEDMSFNPKRDISVVESGLATDLTDALKTGVVKDGTAETDFNGIDDPDRIIGRVNDRFDAIEASRAVKKYGKVPVETIEKGSAGSAPAGAEPSSSGAEPSSSGSGSSSSGSGSSE